VDDC